MSDLDPNTHPRFEMQVGLIKGEPRDGRGKIHRIPVPDVREHITNGCWCLPTIRRGGVVHRPSILTLVVPAHLGPIKIGV